MTKKTTHRLQDRNIDTNMNKCLIEIEQKVMITRSFCLKIAFVSFSLCFISFRRRDSAAPCTAWHTHTVWHCDGFAFVARARDLQYNSMARRLLRKKIRFFRQQCRFLFASLYGTNNRLNIIRPIEMCRLYCEFSRLSGYCAVFRAICCFYWNDDIGKYI